MAPLSIKSKVTLVTTASLLLLLVLITAAQMYFVRNEMKQVLADQQFTLVSGVAGGIDEKLGARYQGLIRVALAIPPELVRDPGRLEENMAARPIIRSLFDTLFVVAPSGEIIIDLPAQKGRRGHNIQDREYFQHTLATHQPHISRPFRAAVTGLPVLVMSAPMLNEKGEVVAILAGTLNLLKPDFLGNVGDTKVGKTGYFLILTREDPPLIVTYPDKRRIMTAARGTQENARMTQVLAGYEGTLEGVSSAGLNALYTYKSLKTVDWILVAALPTEEAFTPIAHAEARVAAVSLVLALLLAPVIWFGVRRVLQPLSELRDAIRHIREYPDAMPEVKSGGRDEIGDLGRDFNAMVLEQKRADAQRTIAEEKMRISEGNLAAAQHIAQVGSWELDLDNLDDVNRNPLRWSDETFRIFGYQPGEIEVSNENFFKAVHPDDRTRIAEAVAGAIRDGAAYSIEHRIIRPDGRERIVLEMSGIVHDPASGKPKKMVGTVQDITERKRSEEQLAFLAQYDTLTGLPNRHMLHDRLSQMLLQTQRNGGWMGCMFIDLDRFKNVNDTFGHSMGDKLLVQVAERLRQCVRNADTVGRLGGDEFAVVLASLAKPEDGGLVAQKVIAALAVPFDLDAHATYVTASVGIAIYPDNGADADELLRNADTAMYRAKDEGRNNHQIYLPQMNERAVRRAQLEMDLRGAQERDEFLLHYQPKVDLTDGAISGFEALLRWRHPERGLVSPLEFIPVLEDTGLIVPVGDWVLHSVCDQIKRWQTQGLRPRPVAVNLSARQFLQADLDVHIQGIIGQYGIDCALIKLEITESMLMRNPEAAAHTLGKLKQVGVKLSVDDFGTGYSSLAYLKRFPLDELKIDRVFVRDVTTGSDDAEIAMAIISLAHNLQLNVVAEGVETEAQLSFLRSHGCDEMQGYYFSRPLKVEDCTRALADDRHLQIPAYDDGSGAIALLIVDDNAADLELMQVALGPGGYRVLTADSPQAAFEVLAKHGVSIILSDHDMPGMTGVKFLSSVRKLYPHAVRIVVSGRGDAEMVTDAVNEAGIHKFLSKDWDPARLRAEVREAYLRNQKAAE